MSPGASAPARARCPHPISVTCAQVPYPASAPPPGRRLRRILLLNPFVYQGKNPNIGIDPVIVRHAGQEIKTGVTFPYGLASIGALLHQHGYHVHLLDPFATPVLPAAVHEAAAQADALIYPYSPVHHDHLARFSREFRSKFRIAVGSVAAQYPELLFTHDLADVIVAGEAEPTCLELLASFPDWQRTAGIIYRTGSGAPCRTPSRALLSNLDSLPFPLRNFTDPRRYWDISFFGQPTAWILASRGCPFRCRFCAKNALHGTTVRVRSPRLVVDEIAAIQDASGISNFVFFDETFNFNDDFCVGICDEIIRRRIRIRWWCAARPDLVTATAARRMRESGCREMRFGIESADDRILAFLNKDTTVAAMQRGIALTHAAGINVSLQCIFGTPGETAETIARTLRFVRAMRPLYVSFNLLTPLPGSRLFDEERDRLHAISALQSLDILHTSFSLCQYTPQELSAVIRRAYRQYYLSFGFLSRLARELARQPEFIPSAMRMLARQAGYMHTTLRQHRPDACSGPDR